MTKIYWIVSLVFLSFSCLSQTAKIKGIITDQSSKETLVGATVSIADGSKGVISDVNGFYTLTLDSGNYQIVFRMIGYNPVKQDVVLKTGQELDLNVSLVSEDAVLNTVVVSAGKFEQKVGDLTVSMEVIKPKLVENKGTYNIQSAINQTPGVSVIGDQPNIRGGSGFSYGAGSRVLIMMDDLPLLAPDAQDTKWNAIPTENLSQIEVIKGASSALFGSSALNGVINIRTAYPTDKPVTKVNVFTGIYDSLPNRKQVYWNNANPVYTGMNFFHSRQINNFDLVVGGNVFTDQGYRELETEQRARFNINTRYRFKKIEGLSAGINANIQYAKGGLFLLWQNADSGAYRPLGGSVSDYSNSRTNVDPFITYFSKRAGKFSLRSRIYNTTNINNTNQGSNATLYYNELQHQKTFAKNLTLTSGFVYSKTAVLSQLYKNHFGENKAAYLQVDKKFFDKLNINFGVRGEYFRTDTVKSTADFYFLKPELSSNVIDSAGLDTIMIAKKLPFKPVFRIGVSYTLTKATFLRASLGQGYRFASIAERYVKTFNPIPIYPNRNIKAETGWSAEIGVKQGFKISKWSAYIDAAAFWTEYQNMIQYQFGQYGNPYLDPMFGLGFAAQNIGFARISGYDISLVGQGKIFGVETTVLAGYTYINPINLTYWRDTLPENDPLRLEARLKNNELKYRFRNLVKADVQFDYKKFGTGLSFRYNSFMRNIDPLFEDTIANVVPGLYKYRRAHNKGDYVFDYRVGYQFTEQMRISFIINNILNREYMIRPADMQPPRTFQIQFSFKF